jgi:hypothetical protein
MGQSAMKTLLASLLLGLLLPNAALPAEIGQPISLLTVEAQLQITRHSDFATKKREYIDRAADEVREMQQVLYRPDDSETRVGRSTGNAVGGELYTAWNNVKTASRRLQSAAEDNWSRATSSYEHAAEKFRAIAYRAGPDDE